MNRPQSDRDELILAEELPKGLEIVTHGRRLHMYSLTHEELVGLQTAGTYKTLDIAMLSLCTGLLVALVITLATVQIEDAHVYAAFVATAAVSGIGVVFFGLRAAIAWGKAASKFKDLTGQS